jgi:hypothetical protein
MSGYFMITHMETPTTRDEWAPLLDQLNQKRAAATAMGGEERVAKHRSAGKLDARQRLDRLFDPGTFVELGALVGNVPEDGAPHAPADALVGGIGEIDGRSAVAAAEDFTVLGGSTHRISDTAWSDSPPRSVYRLSSCSKALGIASSTPRPGGVPTISRRWPNCRDWFRWCVWSSEHRLGMAR